MYNAATKKAYTQDQADDLFSYHTPNPTTIALYSRTRDCCKWIATSILDGNESDILHNIYLLKNFALDNVPQCVQREWALTELGTLENMVVYETYKEYSINYIIDSLHMLVNMPLNAAIALNIKS